MTKADQSDAGRNAVMREVMGVIKKGCPHDMGFDPQRGPDGCDLDADGQSCVCRNIWSQLSALTAAPAETVGRGEERDDKEILTIIARSLGRTVKVENHHQRAQDILDSICAGNLTLPEPSKIEHPLPPPIATRYGRC